MGLGHLTGMVGILFALCGRTDQQTSAERILDRCRPFLTPRKNRSPPVRLVARHLALSCEIDISCNPGMGCRCKGRRSKEAEAARSLSSSCQSMCFFNLIMRCLTPRGPSRVCRIRTGRNLRRRGTSSQGHEIPAELAAQGSKYSQSNSNPGNQLGRPSTLLLYSSTDCKLYSL